MRIKHLITATCVFFIFLVCYELYGGYVNFRSNMYTRAKDTADVFIAFRQWNTQLGGLYAVQSAVPPDPYLRTDRELNAGGKMLTRVNPAYMTHLVSKILDKTNGVNVRMVGEKFISPKSRPAGWEKNALKKVLKTGKDYSFIDFRSPSDIQFRYIRPVLLTKGCMQCHKEATGRRAEGGISISFPVTYEHNRELGITVLKIIAYIISAVLVILLILNSRKKLIIAWEEKLHTISELEKQIALREMSENALVTQTRSSSINEILSLIAHHWRQPLNNVGLLIQTISVSKEQKELTDYSRTAMDIVKEMSDTITLFTSTVKASQAGQLAVKEMVFDTLRLLKPEFESSGIKTNIKCALGGTPGQDAMMTDGNLYFFCGQGKFQCDRTCGFSDMYIEGDEAAFKQILLILLKNARDSVMELSSGKERIISIIFDKKGDFASVSVCDSGTPITPEIKERLFDPYFTTKGYEAGRGIGLFTAKSMTSSFRSASLYFDDSQGKCFVFEFRECSKK